MANGPKKGKRKPNVVLTIVSMSSADAPPRILQELVEAGRLGTKSGAGFFEVPAERANELVAYRNRAYVAMQALLDELGPAPI